MFGLFFFFYFFIMGAYFPFFPIWLHDINGNDSNLLIVFYVQIMPDDFVMQLHRF
ncbi:MFS transporter [Escherichia coli]